MKQHYLKVWLNRSPEDDLARLPKNHPKHRRGPDLVIGPASKRLTPKEAMPLVKAACWFQFEVKP